MDAEALLECLQTSAIETDDATAFLVRLKPGADQRAAAAEALARDIVSRCLASDGDLACWEERFGGGQAHGEDTRTALAAYFPDFDPSSWGGEDRTRLRGAVVEHFWAAIASALEGGWGSPLHVEHDHFSVIDHGPDGLSIYEAPVDPLRFRLWESKRHASNDSVTRTVTEAAEQLHGSGPEYIARVSKPLQGHPDARIRDLAGRVAKLWTSRDERCAVGVSVGKPLEPALTARPFTGLRRLFEYEDVARREGLIIEIEDLDDFADSVRDLVFQGID